MKGYTPVDVPTKSYIKAYIVHTLGPQTIITPKSNIGQKLIDVLQHTTNERMSEYSNARYNATIRLYINKHLFRQRGAYLNETNIKQFNGFVEAEIKARFYFLMDFCNEVLPGYEVHNNYVRKMLGIDIEDWDDDSMRKDYLRYRKRENKPLLYNKNITRSVPSGSYQLAAF